METMEDKVIEAAQKELKKLGLSSFFKYKEGSNSFVSENFLNRYGSKIYIRITYKPISTKVFSRWSDDERIEASEQMGEVIKSAYVWKFMDFFKDENVLSWDEDNEVHRNDTSKGIDIYYRSGVFVKLQLNGRIFFITVEDRYLEVRQYPKKGKEKSFGNLHEAVNYILAEADDKTHAPMDDSFDESVTDFIMSKHEWVCKEECYKKSDTDPNDTYYCRSAMTFIEAFEKFCASVCGVDKIKKDDGTYMEFHQIEFGCLDRVSGSANMKDAKCRAMNIWHPSEGRVGMRKYFANGAYNDMFTKWKETMSGLHCEQSWLMKVHYDTGDTIGRGYGKLTVLKPFDAYLGYIDYRTKTDEIFNTVAVMPQMGYGVTLDYVWYMSDKRLKENDKTVLEEGLVRLFHKDDGYDLTEHDVIKASKEYISAPKVHFSLLHDAPEDSVMQRGTYFIEKLEEMFFRSDRKGYKRPKGLRKFFQDKVFMSDIVSVEDDYDFRVVRGGTSMEPKEIKDVLMVPIDGDFPKVYDKLKAAGFKPYKKEESQKLRSDELGECLKKMDDEYEKAKKKTLANIKKLSNKEKTEIVSQWSSLFGAVNPSNSIESRLALIDGIEDIDADELDIDDKLELRSQHEARMEEEESESDGEKDVPIEKSLQEKILDLSDMMNIHDKTKKIFIGGKVIYFDEVMKKKKEDECDKLLALFVKCLEQNGFDKENEYNGDSFDYSCAVTDMFSKGWQEDFNHSNFSGRHEWMRCHVVLNDHQLSLIPFRYSYMGYSNEICDIWFDRNKCTLADRIRVFVEQNNVLGYTMPEERYHREMQDKDERMTCTDFGVANQGGRAIGDAVFDASYKKFLAVCKCFLKELGDYKLKKSENGYAKSIGGFIKCLSDSKAFTGTMTNDEISVMCDIKKMVPKSLESIYKKRTVAYRMTISKVDQYNERCIEIKPTAWKEFEKKPQFQFGMRYVFSEKGDSFVDTLADIAQNFSPYLKDVETFMKEAETDTRRQFLKESGDYFVKEMNEHFNYSHVIEHLAYQHLLGIFKKFFDSIGKEVTVG